MRPLITLSSIGWAYLLHMSRPLGNLDCAHGQAQHYCGWADDPIGDGAGLEQRIAEHLAGRGACITRAAIAKGIEITLVAAWRAPLAFEKTLKRRKYGPRICPICCKRQGRKPKGVRVPALAEQLALPLDCDDDFPACPTLPMDGFEIGVMRGWRAARALAVGGAGEDWDEGLL